MPLGQGSYSKTQPINDGIKIGNYTSIADNVYFHGKNDNHLCHYNKKCVFTTNWDQATMEDKKIEIGNDVWIGSGVRILSGVKIGDGAIIGAGAVVTKDVIPFAVMVGNPAYVTHYRFTEEQVEKLLKIKWWDWHESIVNQRREDMKDIDTFLEKYL